ncbi:cytochrome b/b6 domain-containing protein [Oricola sp.]|uniref:cytochrome b/b6 domain-containing protein n=1 Tax=Oricola sp. TaxID=1979950 RepID=UPI000C92C94B|nr:hypothetical protein [Ahrensia sp.]|tara:strand:- start:7640 stop:8470 length:831 start_codon:yes stop_codon:yes gene_type:complete
MQRPTHPAGDRPLIYRQTIWTRLTHWIWAISLFFLLLTGLQIFNARPDLYLGQQSGFGFDNSVLSIRAVNSDSGPRGVTTVFGQDFDTTGFLGYSGGRARGFPAWATIPSGQDLATGRVVHFFFAWILVGTLLVWLVAAILSGHLRRDIIPRGKDFRNLGRDIRDHARFRFHHTGRYNTLQKLSYFGVLIIALPLMIATGLAMSPGMNAAIPFITDIFGGRQSARTIHFAVMLALVAFFFIHILMVVAAGPINELRSIVTGWYRTEPDEQSEGDKS